MKEDCEAFIIESQGKRIFGVLHLPENVPICPIVIILHGYASSKVGSNRSYVKLASQLALNGIGCCRFDFRGAGDSEGDITAMNIEDFFADTKAIISYLHEKGFTNIGIFGSSLGGSIAILTASRISVKALALWAPVASGILWYQDWIARQHDMNFEVSKYQGIEISEDFKREFAKFRADELLAQLKELPVLHMQGDGDEIVSMRHQHAFEKARKTALGESKFLQYHEKEHQLGKSTVFPEVSLEICQWFKTHLGSYGRAL